MEKKRAYQRVEWERVIDGIIEDRKDLYISILSTLLRFRTISIRKPGEDSKAYQSEFSDAFRYIGHLAEVLELSVRNHEDMALVLDWEPETEEGQIEEPIGIAAHLDVVPEGLGWTYPPFGGTVAEGSIWGRGAQDDKGGLAMTLAAFDVLRRTGCRPERGLRLLIGTREETREWEDIDILVSRGEVPPFVVVPDGSYPVINGEKGMVMIQWDASWENTSGDGASLSPEIEPVYLRGGIMQNMVPDHAEVLLRGKKSDEEFIARRLAEVELTMTDTIRDLDMKMRRHYPGGTNGELVHFEVELKGLSAHSAYPEKGHNAVLDALELMQLMEAGSPGLRQFCRVLRERCGQLDGSGFGLDHNHSYTGSTTVNLGVIDISPGNGMARINVRFPFGLTTLEVREKIKQAAEQDQFPPGEIDGAPVVRIDSRICGRAQEPLFVPAEDHRRFLGPLGEIYREVTGRSEYLDSIPGTTYAKAFDLAVAFGPVDIPGGEEELAHEPDERVSVERFLQNIKIYSLALACLSGLAENPAGNG